MALNLRRGLSRTYLLLSAIWLIATAFCGITYAGQANVGVGVLLFAVLVVGVLPPALLYMLGWVIAGFSRPRGDMA